MNILGKQKLSKLFVGRHKLLRYLKQIFADISQSGAHDQAYCLLNAPGTGKTTLITKFGEIAQNGYEDPEDPNNKVSGIFV
ncbi:MAG: hypothetical protein ACTSO2_19880, partial [Promethearchaeota archaeon]